MPLPNFSDDFQKQIKVLEKLSRQNQFRECYGVSNSAKFVTGGFLCGIPNLDNLSSDIGVLCVFSRIQLSPESELHTALLIRTQFLTLIQRLNFMVEHADDITFRDRNQNCALFLAGDGKIYLHNKAKDTFSLTGDVLTQIGPGITHDTLFWAIYGNESEVGNSTISQIERLGGSERLIKINPSPSVPNLFNFLNQLRIDRKIIEIFTSSAADANLKIDSVTLVRFLAALGAKAFIVFTGLAGSGKTKLAEAFARWICPRATSLTEENSHYVIIPVGADWIGNENIVGYPDGLDKTSYITKPALELICHALDNLTVPHFLILDEMNLSHVERYFADVLSVIESGGEIPLHEEPVRTANGRNIPKKVSLPSNLFIIGTVNVDESTYMFSPKVLDRANVIEFRIERNELQTFLAAPKAPKLKELDGKGAAFGEAFVQAAGDRTITVPPSVKAAYEAEMLLFFDLLHKHNAEFGYRVAYEAARFIHFYKVLGGYGDEKTGWFSDAMDAVIVQKFLPKLHGSRSKLEGLLWALAWACAKQYTNATDAILVAASQAQDETKYGPEKIWDELAKQNADDPAKAARYPLSFAKVMRMWRKLVRDQFVTFAEA